MNINIEVDSRVRDQLSLSPVDHKEITVGFNQSMIFVGNKIKNIYIFPHTIFSHLFSYPCCQFHHRPFLSLVSTLFSSKSNLFFSLTIYPPLNFLQVYCTMILPIIFIFLKITNQKAKQENPNMFYSMNLLMVRLRD